jgi:hypothetical protein
MRSITTLPRLCLRDAAPQTLGGCQPNHTQGSKCPVQGAMFPLPHHAPDSIAVLAPAAACSISKLYMGGTCTRERNNEGSGCSINGTVIPSTCSSNVDPCVCRSVFAHGPSSGVNALTHLGKCPFCYMHCKVWDRQGFLAGIVLELVEHAPTTSSARSLPSSPISPTIPTLQATAVATLPALLPLPLPT